jgi:hypothetical protein
MIVELGVDEMKQLITKPEQLNKIIDEAIEVIYPNISS